jgi:hypothetical protein
MCLKNEKIDLKQFMKEAKQRRTNNKQTHQVIDTANTPKLPILKCNEENKRECLCERHFFIFESLFNDLDILFWRGKENKGK